MLEVPPDKERARQVGEAICNLETSQLGVILSFHRHAGLHDLGGHSHTNNKHTIKWRRRGDVTLTGCTEGE